MITYEYPNIRLVMSVKEVTKMLDLMTMTSHEGYLVWNNRSFDSLLNSLCGPTSKTIEVRVTGPLKREFNGDRWIPRTKSINEEKSFHLMTSSCVTFSLGCLSLAKYHLRHRHNTDAVADGFFMWLSPISQNTKLSAFITNASWIYWFFFSQF